jgi:predicted MFS family arabinose efflux permease
VAEDERGTGRWRRTFAALGYRTYRLWFAGQLVSLVGTWMQSTALGFLIFELTRSPAYLGYVGFAAGIPSWALLLYGGVMADRIPKRRLLLATQTSMMALAFVLAVLTFSGRVQPWHIVALAFALGIPTAFDAPARQAFVLEMVSREALGNAIALNSVLFNAATTVGPAVAGIVYALVGPAWCFAANGASFLAVIAALLMMDPTPVASTRRATSALHDLTEGLRYALGHPEIRTLIVLVSVTSLFGLAFWTLTPAWAVTVLGGDARTNGLLLSARGVGSVLGGLQVAALGGGPGRGRVLTLGSFALPLLVLLFAAVRRVPLALVAMVGVGWAFMILVNNANVLIQTLVRDELRGRVMSLYALTFLGFMPLGALLAGTMAELASEPVAVALGGLVSLACAGVLYVWSPRLRTL